MTSRTVPVIRHCEAMPVTGILRVYEDQAEASAKIPEQWRDFLALDVPTIQNATEVIGASPCTGDHKIHYLCGVLAPSLPEVADAEHLLLPAGEYAVLPVQNPSALRETWGWILGDWLPSSGYTEQASPEFERFAKAHGSKEPGLPIVIGVPVCLNNQ